MAKFNEGDEVYYLEGAHFCLHDLIGIASIQPGVVKAVVVGDNYLMEHGDIYAESKVFLTHDEGVPALIAEMDRKIEHLKGMLSVFIDYKLGLTQSLDGDGT